MTGYILDTSVYIGAFRDRNLAARLRRFQLKSGHRVALSAVVAMELRAGARTQGLEEALDGLIGAYRSRQRVVAPSNEGWLEAGRVLAYLASRERRMVSASSSLTNDALIAVTARESDALLVTANSRDFAAIQRGLRGFQFREISAVM